MIQVSQDEYIRMLDLLKYQAVIITKILCKNFRYNHNSFRNDFILKNTDINEITKEKPFNSETEKNIKDYLNMCNDLGIVFDEYIASKDKYNLSDEYLAELNKTKKQLNDFVFANFSVEELVNNRQHGKSRC